MNLKSLSKIELLNGVRRLRGDERKLDRQIVEYISEIESRRLYAELGYPNVIDWLVKDLGHSESSAYRRMMAARAIRAVPEVAEKIEDGRLNLVTLAKVQSAIRSEEKRTGQRVSHETRSTIIAKTENKTLRETVRIVAEQFPEAMQASGSQIFSTQIVLTEEQLKLLERVRELRSHSNFGAPQGGTTVVFGSDSRLRGGARRTSIAPSTRNFVRRRAGDACEYEGPGGRRCGSRFQTQMEHVIPVALGGMNDALNLRLLCRTHNLLMAEKTLGLNKMGRFRKPL